jgi:hypothetical protein
MGYVIEKREKGRPDWTTAAELKSPYCKGTADNLEPGVNTSSASEQSMKLAPASLVLRVSLL